MNQTTADRPLYRVIYRKPCAWPGHETAEWRLVLGLSPLEEAREVADELRRGGLVALVIETEVFARKGLPRTRKASEYLGLEQEQR